MFLCNGELEVKLLIKHFLILLFNQIYVMREIMKQKLLGNISNLIQIHQFILEYGMIVM